MDILNNQLMMTAGIPAIANSFISTQSTEISFIVPAGVTSISAMAVGGGGGSWGNASNTGSGGGGGAALSYSINIPVTPGETLLIRAGDGGEAGSIGSPGTDGADSYIRRGASDLLLAKGGKVATDAASGGAGGSAAACVGQFAYSGGTGGSTGYTGCGGAGGGGAAGYAGVGGSGGNASNSSTATNGSAGSGGGGGGGAGARSSDFNGGYGGGISPLGQGTSGAGGTVGVDNTLRNGGTGSMLDSAARVISGLAGGGGGGAGVGGSTAQIGSLGGRGCVRILWGDASYPTRNASSYNLKYITSTAVGSGSGTVPFPSGINVGDLLILVWGYWNTTTTSPTVTGPSGWALLGSSNLTSELPSRGAFRIYYKIATASDIGGATSISTNATRSRYCVLCFRDITKASEFSTLNTQTSDIFSSTNVTINPSFQMYPYSLGSALTIACAVDRFGGQVTVSSSDLIVLSASSDLQIAYKIHQNITGTSQASTSFTTSGGNGTAAYAGSWSRI